MPQITGVGLVISCLYDHSLGAAEVWLRRGSGRRSSPDGTCGEPRTNLPFHLTLPKHIAWL